MIFIKTIVILCILALFNNRQVINYEYLDSQIDISITNFINEHNEYEKSFYYKGEHVNDIARKLNKYLKGSLNNKGEYITKKCISVGLDPYLATAVMLQETGCYWGCSKLVRTCNNVAGNKGTPRCNGGSYRKFDSINDGIDFAIKKLNNYYSKGLTSAKEINPYYAEDKTWYVKVNNYMKKLKG